MSKAREQRLSEARKWFSEQEFTDDSHIVKAYRTKFNVDRACAMKELCMLHVLSPEKEASYNKHLEAKRSKKQQRKLAKQNRVEMEFFNLDQDDNFYFIAGYTSGGAPYGVTWEQARRDGLIESDDEDDLDKGELPF